MAQRRQKQTSKKQERLDWAPAFLSALAELGNVSEAAKAAKVARAAVYTRRESDPDFAADWTDALHQAADRLEREALRRAVEGVEEPIYYQGEKVGSIRRYSDTLLIFLLKGAKPEKFRERYDHSLHSPDSRTLDVRSEDLSDDDLAKIAQQALNPGE